MSPKDVPRAQEVFLTPRYLAIVTEYANGGDLAQYMSQLPQARAQALAASIRDRSAAVMPCWLTFGTAHVCSAAVAPSELEGDAHPSQQGPHAERS